jgi:2-dehydropantoate 2-reductase
MAMNPFSRVAVFGAGAVGCYFGAKLAVAGVPVTVIARPATAAALGRDGIRVLQGNGEWRAPVRVADDASAVAAADLVLVAVKSPDSAAAAHALAPHLRAGARVLCLQNGVDNANTIGAIVGCPTYAAVVYVGAQMDAPGLVRHMGRGDLVIGSPHGLNAGVDTDGDVRAVATLFEHAGVPCVIAPDIDVALWSKLAVNCGLNAVSALGQVRYTRIVDMPEARGVVEAAIHETVAVARADNVALEARAMLANTWAIVAAMPQQSSSTAQDLERGKATEIDALNGFVVRRGVALGVPTPVNATLHALVKLREPSG